MALNEKRNEQNQQKWLSRARRERIDLSASVEEALEDPTVEDVSWAEELDEQDDFLRGAQAKNVFPPRLSLQSRPIPALQSSRTAEADEGEDAKDAEDARMVAEPERGLVVTTQNTNILKRFAQRLTSSFAALGMIVQPEVVESSLQDSPREAGRHIAALEPSKPSKPLEPFVAEDAGVQASGPMDSKKALPQPLTLPDESEPHERQGKQRLAGRTTRIHLETPPITAAAKSRQAGSSTLEGTRSADSIDPLQKESTAGGSVASKEREVNQVDLPRPMTNARPELASLTNPSLSAITRKPVEVSSTSRYLPATDAAKEKGSSASRRALSGTGMFEPGQGETIVVNRHVTEASVVLVTLTANPGPVVVQYVTLRPRIGFTVHLTAPSTMRASFNYIVLLGELF